MRVPFSYLDRQFADVQPYLADLGAAVQSGTLTLGAAVASFEAAFATLHGCAHGIGVASGTDALIIALESLGVGAGHEVITSTNTFVATVGAIVRTGAVPVFVDSEDGFVMDVNQVEAAITPRTRAILAVHYTGNLVDMPRLRTLADRHGLKLIEDACQATLGAIDGQLAGAWGEATAFSLHPLKNLHVWGDGGIILVRDAALASRIRRYRNHGLVDRDTCESFGINSRLDTLQALVGLRAMRDLEMRTAVTIRNAARYDAAFRGVPDWIEVPRRRPGVRHVYHLYIIRVKQQRDALLAHLADRGIRAKVHYPIPVHLQPAARSLGYRAGQFPMAEAHGRVALTLPVHPYLTESEVDYVIESVLAFCR